MMYRNDILNDVSFDTKEELLAYKQGREYGKSEMLDDCIELANGLIKTYDCFDEVWDDIDVGISIILSELHTLVSNFEQLR